MARLAYPAPLQLFSKFSAPSRNPLLATFFPQNFPSQCFHLKKTAEDGYQDLPCHSLGKQIAFRRSEAIPRYAEAAELIGAPQLMDAHQPGDPIELDRNNWPQIGLKSAEADLSALSEQPFR